MTRPGTGDRSPQTYRSSTPPIPEIPIVLFSFLLHFVWEFLQVPTYAGMADLAHWEGIKFCAAATLGDVGFALTAFWAASAVGTSRQWIQDKRRAPLVAFIAVGIALTIAFEYYYTNVSLRWSYSEIMPLVPPLGTGLSPLLQWIIIPPLVVWLTRRHLQGLSLPRAR